MRTEKKLWRNRKARKELARRLQSENPGWKWCIRTPRESMWRSQPSYWKKWKMRRLRKCLKRMERPMRIELTPEPWQGSVLPLY
jgi:hypothetical protein